MSQEQVKKSDIGKPLENERAESTRVRNEVATDRQILINQLTKAGEPTPVIPIGSELDEKLLCCIEEGKTVTAAPEQNRELLETEPVKGLTKERIDFKESKEVTADAKKETGTKTDGTNPNLNTNNIENKNKNK